MTACCCIEPDSEGYTALKKADVKRARTAHTCGECGRAIPPGAPYRYEVYSREGGLTTHHTCRLCAAVRDDRFECGWFFGEVWEGLRECMREYGEADNSWLDPPDWPIEVVG